MIVGFSASFSLTACDHHSKIAKEYPQEVTRLSSEGGVGLPFFVGKDLRPSWETSKELETRTLKPFRMTDQLNKVISSENLHGKVAVISFFFSHCAGICPTTIKNLDAVQKSFLKDDRLMLLSFSITPEVDNPKRLHEYAKANRIDYRHWRLITGDRGKIYQLAQESFSANTFSPRENTIKSLSKDDFLHSENIYLIDSHQRLRGVYSGQSPSSIQELVADAKSIM
jgi:protein SCO1/2